MNETETYIVECIKKQVWGGFSSKNNVLQMIEDLISEEGEADLDMLRKAADEEFRKKSSAERIWPPSTDCDRLDDAFVELNERGIIALQNAGMTMSDGHEDVSQQLRKRGREGIRGYCFYHQQDLDRVLDGLPLYLAFGDLEATREGKTDVGNQIKAVLEGHGFPVTWNGDAETRMMIERLDWKRRNGR
jgi:hypothetical protein